MSSHNLPALSVIVPVYNNGRTLETVLASAACQELPKEILIVDDASADESVNIAEKWQKENPEANLRLIRQPEHKFAHFARIEGIRQAKAENIVFLDADDCFTDNGCLASALQAKVDAGADIAHFRTLGKEEEEMIGELTWAAPLCQCSLHGQEIFRKFAERPYPPWTVWGKIFSRSLLLQILPILESVNARGLEDVLLTTLAFANAKIYLGLDEYGYVYSVPQAWPLSRFARRVQGMLAFAPLLEKALRDAGIGESLISAFLRRLESTHAVMDAGRLAKQIEKRMFSGEKPEAIFGEIAPYVNEEELFASLLLAGKCNADRLVAIVRRYFGFENLDG